MNLYQALFADQDLEDLLIETEFPAGSPLAVARARMWEGHANEASAIAAGGGEPWATLISACARLRAGLPAKQTLLPLAEDANNESRIRMWAWTALRKLGEQPSAVHASDILGFVLEVPMNGKLDVLAAYSDGSVRFLGHADQLIIREPGGAPPSKAVTSVIGNAFALLGVPPAARDPKAPAPPPDKLRMTALSPNGVHTVEVPWSDVEAGGKYQPLFDAATKLLDEVTSA